MNDMQPTMIPADLDNTEALALHRSLLTLDTHIDIPWPTGPDVFTDSTRRVDLPKMLRGGVSAGFFVAYLPQVRRTAETEAAAFARAIAMLQFIRSTGRSENGIDATVSVTPDDIVAARRDDKLSVVLAVENGFSLGTDLSRLAEFRKLGATYLTLTHNGHNALADSAIPRADLGDAKVEHGGLSPLGREAIRELNRLGMLVDVAHVSRDAMMQATQLSGTPVVSTHSCVRALCDHPRNMDDGQLDALRDTGGVIQITAVPGFIRPGGKADQVTVPDFVDHIDYAVQRIGIDHVGIGSDFDGGGGFSGWRDAGESANLTIELVRRGYGAAEIAALWGGNFLRVMRIAGDNAKV